MRFHVHVYKVHAKAEIEVEAQSEEEANTKALELKENIEYGEPDCHYIALAFGMSELKDGEGEINE